MACGLPVVATRHGGIEETVEDGVTGILVSERDENGMANAILQLLADPSRATAMGAAGRVRVLKRFTISHTRDRLRAIMGLPMLSRSRCGSLS
jgi:colanic acid/amylovoran biosynthesis glycosyltransferase